MSRHRIALTVSLLTALTLAGCGTFDPTDWFNTKKPLPGERKAVFPGGVPGVPQGVPPELVQGYRSPGEQAQEPVPQAAAEPPAEQPKPKPEAKPRPRQATAPAASQRAPAPTRPAPKPPQSQAQSSASPFPDPPRTTPQQQSQPQPAASPFPDPPWPSPASPQR